ncbi:MAG: hypothetical protein IAF38_14170 [Bacteroidia bacterium]|nr:hypothetical protein [Bacteroidia bacterium]
MSKKIKSDKDLILDFSGVADEKLLSFLLGKIENSRKIPRKLKTKICLLTVELIHNNIGHSKDSAHCIYKLEKTEDGFEITSGNYTTKKNLDFVKQRLLKAKKEKDITAFYYSLLKNTRPGISRKLGLVRIYKSCNGNIKVSSQVIEKKIFIKFHLKLNSHA